MCRRSLAKQNRGPMSVTAHETGVGGADVKAHGSQKQKKWSCGHNRYLWPDEQHGPSKSRCHRHDTAASNLFGQN